MTIRGPHPVWWAMIRVSARRVHIYRAGMMFWMIRSMLELFLILIVWSAVYGDRESVEGIADDTLLVYLTISAIQVYILPNIIAVEVGERIETGQVATDLIRPFSFMKQMIAIQFGSSIGFAPACVLVIPAAMLVGSLELPSLTNGVAYIISFVLAYMVSTLTWLLVGLGGFWLINIGGLRALLSVASGFLSGALIPVWFMPDALRILVQLLPFQAMTFLPASIFSGQVTGTAMMVPLLVQVAWIAILIGLIGWVWARAQRKLVIQGG